MLDPAVLAGVSDLELVARSIVDGLVAGLHRSPFHGYSAEFQQYRHYRPGDDLKYIDWKLFARTDRVYTKQFRETTNLAAAIVLDCSASMGFQPRAGAGKFRYAVLLAAALAHLASRQGDAIGLVAYHENLAAYLPSRTGRGHLRALLAALARLAPHGTTATAAAVRRAATLLGRRGVVVVISDLYDASDETLAELRRAAKMGHELIVFHLLSRDELDFPFQAAAEFVDMETGRSLVADPRSMRHTYRHRIAEFVELWRGRCAAERIDYAMAATDEPVEITLRRYLLRRLDRT